MSDVVSQVNFWPKRLFFVGIGALAALGQAPFQAVGLSLLALAALVFCQSKSRMARDGAWTAWCAGLGYFLVCLHWIVEPFLVDVAAHGALAPFALLGLSGGLALFWGLAGWCAARFDMGAVGFALFLTAAEWLRSTVLTGFPWGLPGYIWVDTFAMGWTAVIGPFGLTWLTLMGCGLVAQIVRTNHPWRAGAMASGAIALFTGLAPSSWTGPVADPLDLTVRLVQPNAPQDEKWQPDKIEMFLRRHVALSQSDAPADLVIWAETAYPYTLERAPGLLTQIAEAVGPQTLVLGAQRWQEGYFNSLAVLRADGTLAEVYDKHHLVPFGEYLPFDAFLTDIGFGGLAANFGGGYLAGEGPRVLDLGRLGKALPLICYEAVFPYAVRKVKQRPDYIVQITNDAWFGGFSGPYQHLVQAQFRAAESGLPLLRVANTGVTAVIDARGRILASLPLGKIGALVHKIPASAEPTLYYRTGDWPFFALYLIFMVLCLLRRQIRD